MGYQIDLVSHNQMMVPLHHRTKLTEPGEDPPPVPNYPPQRWGGEDNPFENCAKKRRVGTTNATIYAPYCTVVMSVTAPLAIGGSTDVYRKRKPTPVMVKI